MQRVSSLARTLGPLAASSLLVAASLAGAISPATAAESNEKERPPAETISAADLAAAIADLNEGYFLTSPSTAQSSAAMVKTLGKSVTVRAASRNSLTSEANKVAGMQKRMAADGRVKVTNVSVSVHTVKREGDVRFVELFVQRTLKGGIQWEELAPYAVVDRTSNDGKLVAGQVFSLDRDAFEAGQIPKALLASDQVSDFDGSAGSSAAGIRSGLQSQSPLSRASSSILMRSASTKRPKTLKGLPYTNPKPLTSAKTGQVSALEIGYTNRTKIRDYALKYALSPNDDYHEWSTDCTNFVSQAVKAGGWKHDTGWFKSDGNWWYTGVWPTYASYTWAAAENWFRFARVESKRAGVWTNVYQLRIGDILQYKRNDNNDGLMDHSMVTTGISNGVPLLSYHTTNRKNVPFTSMSTSGKTYYAHKI